MIKRPDISAEALSQLEEQRLQMKRLMWPYLLSFGLILLIVITIFVSAHVEAWNRVAFVALTLLPLVSIAVLYFARATTAPLKKFTADFNRELLFPELVRGLPNAALLSSSDLLSELESTLARIKFPYDSIEVLTAIEVPIQNLMAKLFLALHTTFSSDAHSVTKPCLVVKLPSSQKAPQGTCHFFPEYEFNFFRVFFVVGSLGFALDQLLRLSAPLSVQQDWLPWLHTAFALLAGGFLVVGFVAAWVRGFQLRKPSEEFKSWSAEFAKSFASSFPAFKLRAVSQLEDQVVLVADLRKNLYEPPIWKSFLDARVQDEWRNLAQQTSAILKLLDPKDF